jgi:hypothetical protein
MYCGRYDRKEGVELDDTGTASDSGNAGLG